MQVSDGGVVRDSEQTPSLEGAESRGRCWAMPLYPYLTKETRGQANLTCTVHSLSFQYTPFISERSIYEPLEHSLSGPDRTWGLYTIL